MEAGSLRRLTSLTRGGTPPLNALILLAVLAPLAYIGYRAMFSTVGALDDEGYVLVSLREFVDGHSLYDDVYSQYGPGLYILVGAPLGLFDLLTTDGAKGFQLLIWLGSSMLTGLTLLRITKNLPVAAVAVIVSFFVLLADVREPLHPGGIICLLLIGIVAAAAFLLPERPVAALFAIGALATAVALMKVNVGGLALIAIIFALVVTGSRSRGRGWVQFAACALLAGIPFLLISGDLSAEWARRLAAVVAIGAVALGLVATRLPVSKLDLEARIVALAAGVAAVALVVIVPVLISGTSISGLARGIVLDPLRFEDIVLNPLLLDAAAPLWGLGWLVAAILVRWRLDPDREWSARVQVLIGALSVGAGLVIWTSIGDVPSVDVLTKGPLWLGAPLVWLVALPPPNRDAHGSFLRALIPALALLQLLHAYPVAGSQVAWSEFLLVLVGGIAIADGIERFASSATELGPAGRAWRPAALVALLAFAAWFVLVPLRDYQRLASARYDGGVSSSLAGAGHLRLPAAQAAQLEAVAADLSDRCTTFISYPGFNSFYPWTGTDPPTSLNAGAWPWLLDAEDQQRVVDEVAGIDGLCVLQSPFMLSYWVQTLGAIPERPLVRFVGDDFVLAKRYPRLFQGSLELYVRGKAG